MTLGLILVVLTLAVLLALLFPLLRKPDDAAQRVDYDIVVYRDQLAEIDMDVERAQLTSDQAVAARAEIYRRILAAEDADVAALKSNGSRRGRLLLAGFLFILIPMGAGTLYAYLGSPELPAKPYAERKNDPEFVGATKAEELKAQLTQHPSVEGFTRLAGMYFSLRMYDQAAGAYQKIIEINGGDATLWSELGEVIVLSQGHRVVPDARAAFAKALSFDPHEARAQFYLGLAEVQINEPRRAVAIWRNLEKVSAEDAPWLPMIREHIASVAKQGGFDPLSVTPEPPSLSVPPDDAAAIMAMKPEEQNAVIHKMVDHLAAKMKDTPNDLEGWQRLAKAYRVLGETEKAKEAEDKAAALKKKSK